jgi:hypothetical protein
VKLVEKHLAGLQDRYAVRRMLRYWFRLRFDFTVPGPGGFQSRGNGPGTVPFPFSGTLPTVEPGQRSRDKNGALATLPALLPFVELAVEMFFGMAGFAVPAVPTIAMI